MVVFDRISNVTKGTFSGYSFHLAIKLMVIVAILQSNLSCLADTMCQTDLFCNNIHLLLHIFCVFKIKKNK